MHVREENKARIPGLCPEHDVDSWGRAGRCEGGPAEPGPQGGLEGEEAVGSKHRGAGGGLRGGR